MSTTDAPSRPRMALALLGTLAIVLGIALLPSGRGSASVLSSPSPTPGSTPTPSSTPKSSKTPKPPKKKHHKHTGTTVIGTRLYNPSTGGQFPQRSTVTVSQTTNLTNQLVQVSWTGFTPSDTGVYSDSNTTYPVMVAQCNTTKPRFWNQCYGATAGGLPAQGPFGPMNTAFATTTAKGTGAVDIQILVAAENQMLGCGKHHQCSLVIVPAQGGVPGACSNHLTDFIDATGQNVFGGQGQCSWPDRIVVPLSFVQAPSFCPIRNAGFSVLGSPMLNLAMQQWIGALCASSNPVTMTYNPTITEPEAIGDLGVGLGDVALTSRPGPTQLGTRKYAYAPLAVSAVAIAYWVDNPNTAQPVTGLKLDPRLLAKLLTQSYNFDGDGCTGGSPPSGIGCDGAVDGNPPTLFDDPEFKHLNPHVKAPLGATFQVPTVMSGHSDMTWEVTRWIASNTDGNAFMQGQFDPGGMHVNTNYLSLKYPVDSFNAQDNYPVISHKYSPAFPLNFVVQLQAENTDNGTDYEVDPTTGNFPKDPVEFPGARSLFAVIDEGDAAALQFPVAKILNSAGRYVAPSPKSMASALSTMAPIGGNGVTEQVDFSKKKFGAYPLTMVIYAMVPISGVSSHKAAEIAKFIRFAVGPGQHRGLNVGELPPGYLPLPAKFADQALHAADQVATQAGNPKPTSSPTSSPSPSSSAGGTNGSGPSSGPSAPTSSGSAPSPTPRIVTITLKNAQTAGMVRYALPVLLIVGGLAGLGGTSSLIASTAGLAILVPLRRLRRIRPGQIRLTLRRKS